MLSFDNSWQMPAMDIPSYQFFQPSFPVPMPAPGPESTALIPSSRSTQGRGSVGRRSVGSEDGNRDTRRNFHRKVRTGCATCKVRHVKCDEAKPECRRCSSTGRKCDGYPVLKNERQNAPLLPRTFSQEPHSTAKSRSRSQSIMSSRTIDLSPVKSIGFFEPDEPLEQRYLEMFHHDTLPQIWRLEISKPDSWRRLVTQLIQTEPAVRQSAIALAAAHERQKLVAKGVRDDPNKLALAYYNKAIGYILENANNKNDATHDPVVLLTMCLLFVAIEMFLNRDGPTRIHIQSGVRMLKQVEFPQYAAAEEELLGTSFEALDSHAAIYPGWGSSKYEMELSRTPMIASGSSEGGQPRFEEFGDAISEYYSIAAEMNHHMQAFAMDPTPMMQILLSAKGRLLRELESWKVAFGEFKSRGSDDGVPEDHKFLARVLELAIDVQTIVLKGAFDTSQTVYDELVPEVRALVSRLRACVASRDPNSCHFSVDTLSNELVCIWYLFCVCRDPTIRRDLRALMLKACARRGAWCTRSTHLVMGRIIEIEEDGLGDISCASDVPADQRLQHIVMDVAGARRDVKILYRKAADKLHPVEEVLRHPPRPRPA